MKQEIREKLPTWYNDLNGQEAILTNDFDSLMGYNLIKKVFPDIQVRGFYDFNSYYRTNNKCNKTFGIDLDTLQGRCFGNHITHFYKNPDAINLNNIFKIKYYQKYPLSTAMLICSLYNIDIEKWTDEQLKVLLTIDSAYTGYYADSQYFVDIYTSWLDKLGFRFLEDRILKHMTPAKFSKIKAKYYINFAIRINEDGYLETNIKLDSLSELFNDIIELPDDKFIQTNTYTYKKINPMKEAIPDREDIISMAWTYKNTLKLTLK